MQTFSAAIPTVIEESYSCHPLLREYYDLWAFLDISPELQAERLIARNPAAFEAFQTMWIPREKAYFPPARCENIAILSSMAVPPNNAQRPALFRGGAFGCMIKG